MAASLENLHTSGRAADRAEAGAGARRIRVKVDHVVETGDAEQIHHQTLGARNPALGGRLRDLAEAIGDDADARAVDVIHLGQVDDQPAGRPPSSSFTTLVSICPLSRPSVMRPVSSMTVMSGSHFRVVKLSTIDEVRCSGY